MTDRELDCYIEQEVFGSTFWAEKRGDCECATPYKSGVMPWDRTRAKEDMKSRCRQVDWREALALGFWMDDVVPKYSSDPAADYLVLQKVRTWDEVMQEGFADQLSAAFAVRGIVVEMVCQLLMRYKPGDYARAAKAAIEAR